MNHIRFGIKTYTIKELEINQINKKITDFAVF